MSAYTDWTERILCLDIEGSSSCPYPELDDLSIECIVDDDDTYYGDDYDDSSGNDDDFSGENGLCSRIPILTASRCQLGPNNY